MIAEVAITSREVRDRNGSLAARVEGNGSKRREDWIEVLVGEIDEGHSPGRHRRGPLGIGNRRRKRNRLPGDKGSHVRRGCSQSNIHVRQRTESKEGPAIQRIDSPIRPDHAWHVRLTDPSCESYGLGKRVRSDVPSIKFPIFVRYEDAFRGWVNSCRVDAPFFYRVGKLGRVVIRVGRWSYERQDFAHFGEARSGSMRIELGRIWVEQCDPVHAGTVAAGGSVVIVDRKSVV